MDWNDGTTLSKSKTELLHIIVLEICYNLEQTINSYYKTKSNQHNTKQDISNMKGFLIELECRLLTSLERSLEQFKQRVEDIKNAEIEQLLDFYFEYETFLYSKGLTKWDNIKQMRIKDPYDPEEYAKEEQRVRKK